MPKTNKQGQTIGRKGAESRLRLMAAARELMAEEAPRKLTASAVARKAKLASQTFYLYFKDIEDLLLALSEEAAADLCEVHDALGEASRLHSPFEQSRHFIDTFSAYWDRHRPVLTMRNYLADLGAEKFIEARTRVALPIIDLIADRIMKVHPSGDLDRTAAFARSVVIYSAIERMAARPPTMQHYPAMLSNDDLKMAEIEILALLFTPDLIARADPGDRPAERAGAGERATG